MRKIVALTGAGISQASGIPTYEEAPEMRKLFDIDEWVKDPDYWLVQYKMVYDRISRAKPNAAHKVLVDYEIPIITQNIDQLHQRAGSREVTELHGQFNVFVCKSCGHRHAVPRLPLPAECPECHKYMRPEIVFYGEQIMDYDYAVDKIYAANVLLVVGTSLTTYPANTLVLLAQHRGMDVMTINRDAEKRLPDILEVLTTT